MGVPKVLPLFSSGMQRGMEGEDENETDRPFSTVLRHLHISFLEYLTRRRRFGRLHAIGIGQLAEFDSYIVRCGVGADHRTRPGESPQNSYAGLSRELQDNLGP